MPNKPRLLGFTAFSAPHSGIIVVPSGCRRRDVTAGREYTTHGLPEDLRAR